MDDTLVLDLETKRSFDEVGGRAHIKELGISVAGVYSYAEDAFFAFEEHELAKLEEMLARAARLVGFNIKGFDIPVLEPYIPHFSFDRLIITDIFEEAENFLGHRVGLQALAYATLGVSKSGHGLEALRWFKEGRIGDVKRYCLDDVRITRDLFEYGKKHGHVLFESFIDGKIRSIPVAWGSAGTALPVIKIIEDAFRNRRRLKIEYISSENGDRAGFKKERHIDVYRIKSNDEIEAYCHLRQGLRNFRVRRILKAEPMSETYVLPQDAQRVLF